MTTAKISLDDNGIYFIEISTTGLSKTTTANELRVIKAPDCYEIYIDDTTILADIVEIENMCVKLETRM